VGRLTGLEPGSGVTKGVTLSQDFAEVAGVYQAFSTKGVAARYREEVEGFTAHDVIAAVDGQSVLDLACGFGRYGFALARYGFSVTPESDPRDGDPLSFTMFSEPPVTVGCTHFERDTYDRVARLCGFGPLRWQPHAGGPRGGRRRGLMSR
jgi:hypothetical protein